MNTKMDSKERDNEKSKINNREVLSTLQQRFKEANSELQASGSSASASTKLQNLYQEVQQHLIKTQDFSQPVLRIHDELDKVFAADEVGHSCDLCQRDLAIDPERVNASLRSLQEACVLACGHVYHSKCMRGTTLDLDNRSTDPSCIFCISSSN